MQAASEALELSRQTARMDDLKSKVRYLRLVADTAADKPTTPEEILSRLKECGRKPEELQSDVTLIIEARQKAAAIIHESDEFLQRRAANTAEEDRLKAQFLEFSDRHQRECIAFQNDRDYLSAVFKRSGEAARDLKFLKNDLAKRGLITVFEQTNAQ